MAELDGHNFSYKDSQIAIMVVGNLLFGRNWKLPSVEHNEEGDQESTFDADTLPAIRNIHEMLNKIEALSLKQVGDRVIEADSEGATITHATDATTRKVVGTFAPAGLHINKNEYLPLTTLPLSSETTQNSPIYWGIFRAYSCCFRTFCGRFIQNCGCSYYRCNGTQQRIE